MNKYYVPDISELYIGFEYQQFSHLKGKWDNLELDLSHFMTILDEESCDWDEHNIRVKYLDFSDIESLGFRLVKIHPGTTSHEFETKDSRYMITFDPNFSTGWNITILDEVDFIFFYGYIKNKSELSKILKQIGVIEDE